MAGRFVLSKIYAVVTSIFHFLYDIGILPSYRPRVPTIVVGNLSWGGTGKTPMVMELVRYFEARGKRIGIVCRSYKGKITEPTLVDINQLSPSEWGDEAYLLAVEFPQVKVVVGKVKVECVQWLEDKCDVIIVDDGLQHRRLKGHFYLTLLDASQNLEAYQWAPLGTLRESWKGLKRSDQSVITKTNLAKTETLALIQENVVDAALMSYSLGKITDFAGRLSAIESNARIWLVAGIGNPQSFVQLVEQSLKHKIYRTQIFDDHHVYTLDEVQNLEVQAKNEGALLLTTTKDGAKIKKLTASILWREIGLVTELKGKERIYARLDEVLRAHSI